MAGIFDKEGSEEDVKWSVENTSGKSFVLKAFNKKMMKQAERDYELMYAPAFGLDIQDTIGRGYTGSNVISKGVVF